MIWRIEIRGIPEGAKRPRRRGNAPGVYTPVTQWEDDLDVQLSRSVPPQPMDGALYVGMDFRFPRLKNHPKRTHKPHTSRPDVDNLAKAMLDALKRKGIIRDDAAVNYLSVRKQYCGIGEPPGATVEIGSE